MTSNSTRLITCAVRAMRSLNLFLLLAAFGLMTETTVGQIDRKRQPEADPAPKASFPSFEKFTLKNGLRVYFVRDPRPVVTFRLQVRGGSSTDGKTPGAAGATAELLTKGTKKLSAPEFAKRIDFVGGSIGGSAGADMITFSASGLKKHVNTIIDLYADAIKSPVFPAEEVSKYKQEQITALKASQAEPGTIASNAVNRVLFGTTAYGITPTAEMINALTPEVIAAYHRAHFSPANATLAVVGDYAVEALKSMLEGAFADWKKGSAVKVSTPKFPQLKGRKIVLIDRPTSVQSSIRVLGRGPQFSAAERPKTSILNSIIGGGGLGDRLTMNLRETHSYTYSPFSYFNANLHQGFWVAGADVRNEATDSALKEMLFEIERVAREDVGAEELHRHVQSSTGRFLMSIADPNLTAERIQFIDFYGLPNDYYNRLPAIYASTTPKDLRELASKYLASEDLAIVIVGKASEIKPKLEPFGSVEVWDVELNPVRTGAGASVGMAAEEVWAKMIDARGGKRKLQAITTQRMTSPITITGVGPEAMSGNITMIGASPNKRYVGIETQGMKVVEMFSNGVRVVQKTMGGANEMTGDELAKALESAHILPEVWYEQLGGKLAVRQGKSINGKSTIALDITYPKSGTTTYFLDATTYLPVRTESAEGTVISYGSWKDAGEGLKIPGTMTLEMGPATITATDIRNEINVKIDDATFETK